LAASWTDREVAEVAAWTVDIFIVDADDRRAGAHEAYWTVDPDDRSSVQDYLHRFWRVDYEHSQVVKRRLARQLDAYRAALSDRSFPYEQGLRKAQVQWTPSNARLLYEEAYRFFVEQVAPHEQWLGLRLPTLSELGVPEAIA
jgi:phage I-like protein